MLLIQSLGVVGHFETYTGEITPGLLEQAVALEESAASASAHYSPAQIYALRLMYADRLDEARDRLELALDRAREAGDEFECRNILNHLTQLDVRAGSWGRAEQHARELEELVDRLDFNRAIASYAACSSMRISAGSTGLGPLRNRAWRRQRRRSPRCSES